MLFDEKGRMGFGKIKINIFDLLIIVIAIGAIFFVVDCFRVFRKNKAGIASPVKEYFIWDKKFKEIAAVGVDDTVRGKSSTLVDFYKEYPAYFEERYELLPKKSKKLEGPN